MGESMKKGGGVEKNKKTSCESGRVCDGEARRALFGNIAKNEAEDRKGEDLDAILDKLDCEKSFESVLGELIAKPMYEHLSDVKYIYVSPFLRVQFLGDLKDGGMMLYSRGLDDGERDDFNIGSITVKDGKMTTVLGFKKKFELSDDDINNPFVKGILDQGSAKYDIAPEDRLEKAKLIHSTKNLENKDRQLVPLKKEDLGEIVGQADFSFAQNGEKIATYGLANCVAIAVYNSKTKTGGIAHIDPNIKVKPFFDELMKGVGVDESGSSDIEVSLVGGWSGYSERTVYYLKDYVKGMGLNIKYEDVLGEKISRGIVMNTETGEITYIERQGY
ncbi:hypothetical protein HOE67_01425 [Candidatus Peregrinibacteria bacterium]|nr:hypothetical protein [Candidatus Peregrinibacteria bacterium]MBT4055747.1 hypothetical protein [Candidatus Peregrinibacteria bacterium]